MSPRPHAAPAQDDDSKRPLLQSTGPITEAEFSIPGAELVVPSCNLAQLVLPPEVRETIVEICREQFFVSKLAQHSLKPRNRILLTGPPGTGKTALAGAIAWALKLPLFVLRIDELLGSHMGDFTNAVGSAFSAARNRPCLLFADEADGLLARRTSDTQAVAVENNRATNSALVYMEQLLPPTIFIAATNLQENLDKACFRRFHARLEMPLPEPEQTRAYLVKLLDRVSARLVDVELETLPALARRVEDISYAEIEVFFETAVRRAVIKGTLIAEQLDHSFPRAKEDAPE